MPTPRPNLPAGPARWSGLACALALALGCPQADAANDAASGMANDAASHTPDPWQAPYVPQLAHAALPQLRCNAAQQVTRTPLATPAPASQAAPAAPVSEQLNGHIACPSWRKKWQVSGSYRLQDGPAGGKLLLTVQGPASKQFEVRQGQITPQKGQPSPAEPTTAFDISQHWGAWFAPPDVQLGDFNGDGQPDLLLVLDEGGVGLAGGLRRMLWLLSGPLGYQAVSLIGMTPALVYRGTDGSARLLHRSVVSSPSLDGKTHSYWLHRELRVSGQTLRKTTRPPIWVAYSKQPARQPTRLLSAAQKSAALLTPEAEIAVEPVPRQAR